MFAEFRERLTRDIRRNMLLLSRQERHEALCNLSHSLGESCDYVANSGTRSPITHRMRPSDVVADDKIPGG